MPRIRTIKPEFFGDEKLSKLKRDVRLLYVGLWVFSDDYGTVRSNPVWIKSNVFPYDEELRVSDVKNWLDALVKARMLEPFEYNGEGFYNIRTFHSHQRVEKPSKPIVPTEEKSKILESGNSRGIFPEYSAPEIGSSNRKLEIGNRNGTDTGPDGPGEAKASPPDLREVYYKLEKSKRVLCEFLKNHHPTFIEPYVDLWNLFATEKKLATVSKISASRKKKFAVRINEKGFNFLEILRKAGLSEFLLTGKWFCFDWVLENESNYLKVIEGNYDKKDKAPVPANGKSIVGQAVVKSALQSEVDYIRDRFNDGEDVWHLLNSQHFNHLQVKGFINYGVIDSKSKISIADQEKTAVLEYFKKSKAIKNAS